MTGKPKQEVNQSLNLVGMMYASVGLRCILTLNFSRFEVSGDSGMSMLVGEESEPSGGVNVTVMCPLLGFDFSGKVMEVRKRDISANW